jgi:hypothetical protein
MMKEAHKFQIATTIRVSLVKWGIALQILTAMMAYPKLLFGPIPPKLPIGPPKPFCGGTIYTED